MDSDLYTLMERTVPPIQLDAIGKFRSVLFKYNRKVGVRVNEHVFLAWQQSWLHHFSLMKALGVPGPRAEG